MSISKVILINKSASVSKYGRTNWKKIETALNTLVASDKKRGVITVVIAIDSKTQLKKFNGNPVTKVSSARQVKRAIDAIFRSVQPHYLMILGAPDLIPHVKLRNPIAGHETDEKIVPSDLPYACDAGYGLDIERFIGPTRVLGRLPDIVGQSDPAYLVKLLEVASEWKSGTKKSYSRYFGVSAKEWKGSSRKNVSRIFGTRKKLQLVPPKDPPWTKTQLKPLMHFINCHGANTDSRFFGDGDGTFPEALWSNQLIGNVTRGSVVAAECCYGAQLYAPTNIEPNMGIANRYLGEASYGFLGSTNVAWGSSDYVTLADKVCQFFLLNVLNGSSLGRATLQARQKFVNQEAPMGPHSLKTLAQFTLLGDPSIHPVKLSKSDKEVLVADADLADEVVARAMPGVELSSLFLKKGPNEEKVMTRSQRRLSLFRQGLALVRKIATAKEEPVVAIRKTLENQFKVVCQERGFHSVADFTAYVVDEALDHYKARTKKEKARSSGGIRFLLAVENVFEEISSESRSVSGKSRNSSSTLLDGKNRIEVDIENGHSKIVKRRMLVAVEKDGKIESYEEFHSR